MTSVFVIHLDEKFSQGILTVKKSEWLFTENKDLLKKIVSTEDVMSRK